MSWRELDDEPRKRSEPMSQNCRRCGTEIDTDTCHCGGEKGHCDGHSFTPMLCGCGDAVVYDQPAQKTEKDAVCARCGHPWAEHRVHSRSCAKCSCRRFLKPGTATIPDALADFAALVLPERCMACRRGEAITAGKHTRNLGCSMAHAHYCALCDRTRACPRTDCETWEDMTLDYGVKRGIDWWCERCALNVLRRVEQPDPRVLEVVGDPIEEEGFDG